MVGGAAPAPAPVPGSKICHNASTRPMIWWSQPASLSSIAVRYASPANSSGRWASRGIRAPATSTGMTRTLRVGTAPDRLVLDSEPHRADHREQHGTRANRFVDLIAEVESSLGVDVAEDHPLA